MRPAAEAFLRGSGQNIPDALMGRIMKGLTEIEEAPGLYRPITLNMVGLVLSRMGDRLATNPTRLIQHYLRDCLVEPDIRDHAPAILAHMVSDAGTKRPCTEAELAEITGFEPWRVAGCLVNLDRHGLVRALDRTRERWEIAHDFLARLIGQLLGRLRPPLWRRALPWAAPVFLALWVATVLGGLLYWEKTSLLQTREELADLGLTVVPWDDGSGYVVTFSKKHGDETLGRAVGHLQVLDVPVSLYLSRTRVSDLTPLVGLTALQTLDLSGTRVSDFAPLEGLTALQTLDLGGTRVSDLAPLKGLTALQTLYLSSTRVSDLTPLKGLTALERLDLFDTEVSDLTPLEGLPALERLDLWSTQVSDLTPLEGLTALQTLKLSRTEVSDLTPLKGLTTLRRLDLFNTEVPREQIGALQAALPNLRDIRR